MAIKKYTDYHRRRACPIQGCRSVVKRLSGHIRQVHGDIPEGSPRYKKILKEARFAKTWKPSEQVECCPSEGKIEPKHCSLDESENEEEVTTDTEPSERPSADEEYAIMEAAEEVIFQKRVRVFHRGFKHEKTDESKRPQAECFYCFRVFETLMKHKARVFEITSPTKEN